jgi:ribokinase
MVTRFDVFGLGQCALDLAITVDRLPEPDSKTEFGELASGGGGPVATALAALARWGWSTAFTGIVGDDTWGDETVASLRAEGIDTAGVRVRRGATSQVAFIVTEPETGNRTILWRRPTGDPLRPGEIDLHRLRAARALHTDGLFIEASIAAAHAARNANLSVVVDGGTLRTGMLTLAGFADAFVVSETFARSLIGGNDPEGACRKLAELGPSLCGVTLGNRGYVALDRGSWICRPAHPATAVDTTACGDVFHAGIVHGILSGWAVEETLDFSAWAAARVSEKLGGRTGIPASGDYAP